MLPGKVELKPVAIVPAAPGNPPTLPVSAWIDDRVQEGLEATAAVVAVAADDVEKEPAPGPTEVATLEAVEEGAAIDVVVFAPI